MYNYNPDPTKLVYDISKWDAIQWEDYVDSHPESFSPIKAGQEKVPTFDIFTSEIFHRLYAPEPKPLDNPRPEDAWALRTHEQLTEMPEFDELLTTIEVEGMGDSFKKWYLAGVGATNFSEYFAQKLPSPRNSLRDPQPLRQQIVALKQYIKQLLESAETAKASGNLEKVEQLNTQLDELNQELNKITAEGKKAVANAQKYAERLEAAGLKDILKDATTLASGAVEDAAHAVKIFGWGEGNGAAKFGIGFEDKIKLAQRVAQSPKLREIAKLAGRMKLLAAKKQRTKTLESSTEIYSITTGNDLAHLLPSELAKLVVPELKPLFLKNYTERELLQYQLKSKEKQGRGPIVVCLDSSGSMAGAKECWSKAVAIALLTIANQQKRTCRILHFCESVCRVDDFPGGAFDSQRLIECMECFYAGGTSWEAPLDSAYSIVRSESQYKNADIILITDDLCDVSPGWLSDFKKSQKELEFSTYGVMLESSNTGRLGEILDMVLAIPNLSQDGDIETVFGI